MAMVFVMVVPNEILNDGDERAMVNPEQVLADVRETLYFDGMRFNKIKGAQVVFVEDTQQARDIAEQVHVNIDEAEEISQGQIAEAEAQAAARAAELVEHKPTEAELLLRRLTLTQPRVRITETRQF